MSPNPSGLRPPGQRRTLADRGDLPSEFDERAIMRAWEAFVTGETRPPARGAPVRSVILDSWSRSASSGISALSRAAPIADARSEVERLKRANEDLCLAARGAFAELERLLVGTEAMLVLTDRDGVIIETIGDAKTLEEGRRIHLEVGGVWDESVIGTNGIGTALRSGKPVYVHGAEHFCAGIKSWTCAGAPILDPFDHSVMGLVDLSGPTQIFQRHNTALIAAAAGEIQRALAEQQSREHARLLEAYIDARPSRAVGDGVLILDRLGRVIYSSATLAAGTAGHAARGHGVGRRLLELSENMSEAEIAAALPETLRPSGVKLLKFGGRLGGAALILPSPRRAGPPRPAAEITPRPGTGEKPFVIIGESEPLLKAVELARRAGRAGASVLIQGETGVGKELFARLVHAEGRRSSANPFIAINCGAIARDLFGAELFGHVAGAFTGAAREGKPGKFELADGGVLCLDEIGEMPLDLQPYLLRVLEQRAVYRIGDSKRRPVDVRLVAMTNRDLRREVDAGRFRRDLFYRISTLTIEVPHLRQRGRDIELLAEHFNGKISAEAGAEPLRIPGEVMEMLRAYPWPGNVRELRNLIERLHFLVPDREVRLSDLPPELFDAEAPHDAAAAAAIENGSDPGGFSLETVERQAIMRAISAAGGNMSSVARALGISRPTLYRKIKLYGIRRTYE
ncbi:MAG TPA: sigma-54-dependent Fis family transcriptional regulator [Paracoccaceae bacterium]|nr:sigma-54-dependent Fis family transcriptional regulator [Paracoccaceae bacterium]